MGFLKLMYITNRVDVALIAEKYGVDRIWIDLETLGKKERQGHLDSVKSNHKIDDIKNVAPKLTTSEMLVRVNPINENSIDEINKVIDAGANIIMLPMWKTLEEVKIFLNIVNNRVKTTLLLETKEGVDILDDVLEYGGFDELHIGLNDLHLSYKLNFMFELLTNGTVEKICNKLKKYNIPYGFGGIAKIGEGTLPSEKIIMEHYRLGSTRVILSRSFCNIDKIKDINAIDSIFNTNIKNLINYEQSINSLENACFIENKKDIQNIVDKIVKGNKSMKINCNILSDLREKYGESFYLLDSKQFKSNYIELKEAFLNIYDNFNIAYSYKTNYIPSLCKIVDRLGGYAEVVSEMELELAQRIGVKFNKIIWNGPIKNKEKLIPFLLSGGTVNIDSLIEGKFINDLTLKYPNKIFNVGIRCNYDVEDGVISRFGFDVDSDDFDEILKLIRENDNLYLINLQCHFAKRQIEYWPNKVQGMLDLIDKIGIIPERIDVGGGLFGKMDKSLKDQFSSYIPTYKEYANVIATLFQNYFKNKNKKPELIIEPGSALVGDCMKFVSTVKTIKKIRGKYFATVLGSQKNISMSGVNPPLEIFNISNHQKIYHDLDFVGFTCIEGDILYKNYQGSLGLDDIIVISNCGSYSLVMKPPFILPNFPVLDISNGSIEVIKREETFDDIFHTFNM